MKDQAPAYKLLLAIEALNTQYDDDLEIEQALINATLDYRRNTHLSQDELIDMMEMTAIVLGNVIYRVAGESDCCPLCGHER